ncbi:MAG TPA: phosphomannomutase/phosphoglucomutase, partial [Planctomycetota bacterium]|nr:phosphomannomutase/phosphoglucomutase [Planctomycetota bacterium]
MGIFKAYDVRGIYPQEIGEDVVRRIGNAFAAYLGGRGTIVVGRDMRPSSVPLSKALIEGITAAGCDVVELGMCTTPMCYFGTGRLEATGGVMVTASHNPAQYNGLKFCRERAIPVGSASGLGDVERAVLEGRESKGARKGSVRAHDVVADYAAFLKQQASAIQPMKVAIDTGNGSVGPFVEPCLGGLGLEIVPMFFEPDGTFPNHEANPLKHENIEALIQKVREERCALGIAFDGDGDRCAFVDEKGQAVAGDMVTALIARRVLERKKGVIIYDLRSSRAAKEEIERGGGT